MTESQVLQQGHVWIIGVFSGKVGCLIGGSLRSGKPQWGKDKQRRGISRPTARCKSYEFELETKRIQRANWNDKDNVFYHHGNLLPSSDNLLGLGSTIPMQWTDLLTLAKPSGSPSTTTASSPTTPHGRISPPDQLTGKISPPGEILFERLDV